MTLEELKQAGAIYVKTVVDGIRQYENEIVKMPEKEAEEFFLKKMQESEVKLNAAEMLFSSFYFAGRDGSASIRWGNYGEEYVVMRKNAS